MMQLFKAKSLKNNTKTKEGAGARGAGAKLTSILNERTQEKAILKEGIGTNREAFVSRGGRTRASLFGTYTPSKMGFAASGRSMVEMLGVLAIIGVLSIGGISGYTIAMRRYQVNEIMNIADKYALMLYTSCQNAIINNPKENGIYGPYTTPESSIFYGGVYENWWCRSSRLAFTDAGLGPLPQGLVSLTLLTIDTFHNELVSTDAPDYDRALLSEGTDAVTLRLQFESKALCETACSAFNLQYCDCKSNSHNAQALFIES